MQQFNVLFSNVDCIPMHFSIITLWMNRLCYPFSGTDTSSGYVSFSAHCIGLGACLQVVCVRNHWPVSVSLKGALFQGTVLYCITYVCVSQLLCLASGGNEMCSGDPILTNARDSTVSAPSPICYCTSHGITCSFIVNDLCMSIMCIYITVYTSIYREVIGKGKNINITVTRTGLLDNIGNIPNCCSSLMIDYFVLLSVKICLSILTSGSM